MISAGVLGSQLIDQALAILLIQPLIFAHHFQFGFGFTHVKVLLFQANNERLLFRQLALTINRREFDPP